MTSNLLTLGIHRFFGSLEIDKAVTFVLITRAWQAFAGLGSLFLIARYFSPETQGFYYTVTSLLALQSFVELGFYIVIINIASHEWSKLHLDCKGHIRGEPAARSRLASLGYIIGKWYVVASLLFVACAGMAGHAFFSREIYPTVLWQAPWWSVVVLTGMTLWGLPFISLLEGCNQVVPINQFRLIQTVLGNAALWLTMCLGGGLWAAAALAGMNALCAFYLLCVHYRQFFLDIWWAPREPSISWSGEIWPMQWRLALQGMVNYLMFSMFTPVMFHYHGAQVAGQMGMTWQAVNMVQSLAMAWLQTKVPTFGVLIAQSDYGTFEQLWHRVSRISIVFVSAGSGLLWLTIYGLNFLRIPLAERLLDPLPVGMFLLAAILIQIVQCQAAYLRAHKKEPLLVSGVTSGVASGLLVWWMGSSFGATGAAIGYLIVVSLVTVPATTLIWIRSRVEWHKG